MNSELIHKLKTAAGNYVEDRIQRIHTAIADLEDALKLETKCSMGDKYETGRAMLHLEFEKLSAQLEQYSRLKKTLTFIKEKQTSEKVEFGSVVKTEKVNYFISIPAGELEVEGEKFYAIGAGSPVAQAMTGRSESEEFTFNGITNKILKVL
ncbi:transcription elongation factor [Salinimicrobium sp. GXAS 041]|uniref:transcription elongation factor n=1 Tax=Salinimicrobium sp. GXAS 041 TaxID=3400806 RepID=UPI003C764F10